MELNKTFKDGLWSKEINVRDFVSNNITPYEGDASFLPNAPKLSGITVSKLSKKRETIMVFVHSTTQLYLL